MLETTTCWFNPSLPYYCLSNFENLFSIHEKNYNILELSVSDYNAEEQQIRPLKIIPLSNVTCRKNLKAFSHYLNDVFYLKHNFSKKEALEMFQDETNYSFKIFQAATVGKLFDVIVDPVAFKQAVIQAKPGYANR